MAWRRQEPRTHRSRNELGAPNASEYLQGTVHQRDPLVMPLHLWTSESPPEGRPRVQRGSQFVRLGPSGTMHELMEEESEPRALDVPAALGESNGASRFQNCPIRPARTASDDKK
jgi:hypothetical protein